ncbi:BRISC and BRCA1-A complex member 2-like [Homarus americanus]|uniref:BRISC and BRCA1-A complex member 2 n=1 Tax=Homarus americanus TaxID=6706 RepID=A0A8J5JAJ8_HOMAM|nr:BRISC and BRCA1-A complex member 2-like [Homarus americanus]
MEIRDSLIRGSVMEQYIRQIGYIKLNGFPGGLCSDLAEITGASESLTVWNTRQDNGVMGETVCESGPGDELLIKVPFAGATLTIRLLFYLREPWMPPDMSFSDIQFLSRISTEDLEDQVPALNNWNCSEDDIIAQLLHQLLQLYKKYQLEKLDDDEVLQFEYRSLLKTLKIGEGDIEILVNSPGHNTSSLLVRLPLSLQDVPPVLIDANPGSATSLLQNEGVFVPKLYLSPRVESLIGGANTLALPAVPPGTCLLDYVERVLELLEEKVRKAVLCFETRKQFIAQVLCQFGCAVMEYDAERFSKVVLMFEVKDFHFLTFITLGQLFPQFAAEAKYMAWVRYKGNPTRHNKYAHRMTCKHMVATSKWAITRWEADMHRKPTGVGVDSKMWLVLQQAPKIVLQSLYHNSPREPYSKEYSDQKYSPQWTPEEMVRNVRDVILSNVSSFQMSSIRTN